MNNLCTLYIVRHAKSEANVLHLRAGQTDFDISEEGIQEAKALAKEVKNIHFDAVFSSDLLRAKKTAQMIAKERDLEIHVTKQLRERAWGKSLEGKTVEETKELLDAWEHLAYKERYKIRPLPDVETDEELMTRFLTFLREVANTHFGKTVLVVSHSNMMRTLLVHLGWAKLSELDRGSLKNTGYFVLKSDGVEFEVVKTMGVKRKS